MSMAALTVNAFEYPASCSAKCIPPTPLNSSNTDSFSISPV
jgi:hypothetical protein